MKHKKSFVLLVAAVLALGKMPGYAAEHDVLTRGEAATMLMTAADDYNPDVQVSDILIGYPDGALDLEGTVTRVQALVMLGRAFDELPAPVGDNARMAIPSDDFTDIPDWAADALTDVLSAGIVAGTGEGLLSPNQPVTEGELDTLIRRVYALKGTNLKDDFYATINKDWLDASTIPTGLLVNGPVYGLNLTVDKQIATLIQEIAATPQQSGTVESKIKALYDSVLDAEGRKQAGITPIQPYLDAIENAQTLEELMQAHVLIQSDLTLSPLLGFGLTTDLADSTQHMVAFGTVGSSMNKEFYTNGTQEQKDAYLNYLTTLYTLSGLSQDKAEQYTKLVYETEALLSAASLDPQDYYDVDKIYHLYTLPALQAIFPNVDLSRVYAVDGWRETDKIMVQDVGAMQAAASLFDQAHLDTLKALARLGLLRSVGKTLNQDFLEASFDFTKAYYGVDTRQSNEEIAALQMQNLLSDYLGRLYVETYFSPQAKADVEQMVHEFLDIYRERIEAQTWMSDATKQKALQKLDTMSIKVGYPDHWESYLDSVTLRSPKQGGSFFSNVTAIRKAIQNNNLSLQNEPVDKTEWPTASFVVNAFYDPSGNEIIFPAAILQAPLYDINASREQNLGGIGYIIAHEITHAFDNNGSKFDEHGNAVDWWSESDYAAFAQKCQAVAEWYDGQEAYPGIVCNSTLTISENIADLGAAQCLMIAARKLENPDFDTLFRSLAYTRVSTTTRQFLKDWAATDVHAPDKLRCNRVLQTLPEFYQTYDIQPEDGMWTEPDSRVSIW